MEKGRGPFKNKGEYTLAVQDNERDPFSPVLQEFPQYDDVANDSFPGQYS